MKTVTDAGEPMRSGLRRRWLRPWPLATNALVLWAAASPLCAADPATNNPYADVSPFSIEFRAFPFVLSEGTIEPAAGPSPDRKPPVVLSTAETAALLSVLPPFAEAGSPAEFTLEKDSASVLMPELGPATAAAPTADYSTSLSVHRFGPVGKVTAVDGVRINFDRPMVALGDGDHLTSIPNGVSLEPAVDGRWRWLGTQLLEFQPALGHMPMSTAYKVRIDSGIAALDGATLNQPLDWKFETPRLKILGGLPVGDSVDTDPIMSLRFNQRIDRARLFPHIALHAGNKRFALRLASDDEATEAGIANEIISGESDHRIVLRAAQALPTNTGFELRIDAQALAAEGHRSAGLILTHGFRTYGPLRATLECHGDSACNTDDRLTVNFSTPLAESSKQQIASLVQITPPWSDLQVNLYGQTLGLYGNKPTGRRYRVRLSPEIEDIYGQRLNESNRHSIKIARDPPVLYAPGGDLATLSPNALSYTYYSLNYESVVVKIYRVTPADWPRLEQLQKDELAEPSTHPKPPGELIAQLLRKIDGKRGAVNTDQIDLAPYLSSAGTGQLLLSIEPGKPWRKAAKAQNRSRQLIWLQATKIALHAYVDGPDLMVWANRLLDGQPLAGVELQLENGIDRVATNEQGLARLLLNAAKENSLLIARLGDDGAMLKPQWQDWEPLQDSLLWHVIDDRQIYRPGETAQLKGWVRELDHVDTGGLILARTRPIKYLAEVGDQVLAEGVLSPNQNGSFDLHIPIPDHSPLGLASVEFTVAGDHQIKHEYSHNFQIEQFRTPEFNVSLSSTPGPHFPGEQIQIQLQAEYYSGGALAHADMEWASTTKIAQFVPPNRADWWFGVADLDWDEESVGEDTRELTSLEGSTDANGVHALTLTLAEQWPPLPLAIQLDAQVADQNNQSWAGEIPLLAHPASAYIGIQVAGYAAVDEPVPVSLLVVDINGTALSGRPVEVEAVGVQYDPESYRYVQAPLRVPQRCVTLSDRQGLAQCNFTAAADDALRVSAITRDEAGRANLSSTKVWVSGNHTFEDEDDPVTIIPDRLEYSPGDRAEVLVLAKFATGEGVLQIHSGGRSQPIPFSVRDSRAVVALDVPASWAPRVRLSASIVESTSTSAIAKQLDGHAHLGVSQKPTQLQVLVAANSDSLAPGSQTVLELQVNDYLGQPLSHAELTVIVVDEAVLALSNYQLADPSASFYGDRDFWMDTSSSRERIASLTPEADAQAVRRQIERDDDDVEALVSVQVTGSRILDSGPKSYSAEPQTRGRAPKLRADFTPLAAFLPNLLTDTDGRVNAVVKLPDNLTRYRVMVIASAGADRFGVAESSLTTALPLMVRPSPPRFLHAGDRFKFPVTVQNQSDEAVSISVALAGPALELGDPQGYRVEVPANDRTTVSFPAHARAPGKVDFQVIARATGFADASAGQIPVRTPATIEREATYGVLDQGAVNQGFSIPPKSWSQIGGLQLSIASTALQSLTDAFIYLQDYPYECSEQIASRIIANASLGELMLGLGNPALPDRAAITAQTAADVGELLSRQDYQGNIGLWSRHQQNTPFVSLHGIHALLRAELAGYRLDTYKSDQIREYLREVGSKLGAELPTWIKLELRAYAAYLRRLAGDSNPADLRELLNEIVARDEVSAESLAWLLSSMSGAENAAADRDQLVQILNNRIIEDAASARLGTPYREQSYRVFSSARRADAVVLDALIAVQPESTLIPKLVHGLQQRRNHGHWGDTQENAFVLLAMRAYFERYEAATPDFVARIWLGEDYAGEQRHAGRDGAEQSLEVPMNWLQQHADHNSLTLSKQGAGRLYYRLGLSHAPQTTNLNAVDRGFAVQRRYEAIDDPSDVLQRSDGTWQIRAGARVRVALSLTTTARRYHVALTDPLAAGLEAVNPAFAVSTPTIPNDDVLSRWFEHQNLRSERVEAFTTDLASGNYRYSYIARATTVGEFIVPPSRAETMYEAEVYGHSASDRVIVVDAD